MTPPDSDEDRARVLLTACGFGVAALAAIGALLLLGVKHHERSDFAFTPPSTRLRDSAASSVPGNQAQRTAARRSEAIPAEAQQGGQLFSQTSFWNERLSSTTPLDPSSPVLVQRLVAEVQREQTAGVGPSIAANSSSTPVYRVGSAQAPLRVRLDSRNVDGGSALQRAFAAVPIPREARPADKPNGQMTVWQPSTDTLWEFSGARKLSDGWHAAWGGAIRRVSESRGFYTGAAWPGATRNWGASSSSLPVIGGTMLVDELRTGRIDHALALNVPAARAHVFSWPAQRTDGNGPADALPEGSRLRLDPTLDVGSLHLPKLTRMIALAAQRFGFVVRDQTDHAISLVGENPAQFPGDPYRKYFQGRTPQRMLADFPWDRLQVLQMHLCTAAPCGLPS